MARQGWWAQDVDKEEWEKLFPYDDSDFPKSGTDDKEGEKPEEAKDLSTDSATVI